MKVVELSGGVGGARLARGLAAIDGVELTVVVNVGDDTVTHGLYVSPDLDTVIYTLAGEEGPHGWGRRDDTFTLNTELARFGLDNTFQLGDRDLALKIYRTAKLKEGHRLSEITRDVAASFEIPAAVIPVTDDALRTEVRLDEGWVGFQEYFVGRGHRDEVHDIRFEGADNATAAPGVPASIHEADLVVIGPSNPPLSIWPILALPEIRDAVESHPEVAAVSPLIGGKTVRGPADRVMTSLGLQPGTPGVARAYEGLIDRLFVDSGDKVAVDGLEVVGTNIMIKTRAASTRLAEELIDR